MENVPTYTGSTIKTYLTVVGFVNGETGAAYVETRNVPTAPLAVQTEGIELNNYSIASEIVFTMNKKQTSVSQSGTYTYNGTAQTVALSIDDIVEGDDIEATIDDITNAGSYTPVFTITGADAGNYEITN